MTRSPLRKRPTQADVAQAAGVSQTVVSLVLNERSAIAIAPETRQRVLDTIQALGYVPDGAAQSLRTGKTLIIASLIPDIANPFYPAFQRGIQDVVDTNGYDLTAYNTDGVRLKELRGIRAVQRLRADGVIVTPFQLTPDDFAPLHEIGVPIVIFGEFPDEPDHPRFDSVYLNDEAAAAELMTHLVSLEKPPIALITGPDDVLRREGRVRAFERAVAEHHPPGGEIIAHADAPTETGGYAAMQELLDRPVRPRTVFAANDLMAIGAIVAIREVGLTIPDDIAVAGFDDISISRLITPALTTVAQYPEHLGRRAAELLFDRIHGATTGSGRKVLMPHQLIVRSSA